ncbi:MAG: sugar phosphate isomerase/epimerase [Defluviitaleaceae bacterium]|nr:sugar phosphate isomerase/epimerase [Defluviitaleaceae bacterium]
MKIGAQLNTIRDFTQTHKDFASSMKKISKIGFDCVQASGISSIIPPEEIDETCKAYGLEVVIAQADPERVRENTKEVIAEHKMMGAKYVSIDMLPKKYERNKSGFMQFFLDFRQPARAIKDAGLQLLYHNHYFEFERFDGKICLEFIRDNLTDVNFTLDTYWIQAGGGDPAHWIKKLEGRVNVIHLQDFSVVGGISRMSESVLEGNLNWQRIIGAAEDVEVEYAMIEQDECYGKDPFECLKTSLYNLRNKLPDVEFEYMPKLKKRW